MLFVVSVIVFVFVSFPFFHGDFLFDWVLFWGQDDVICLVFCLTASTRGSL